jgi:tRNA(Ile2) C34 agmatinyltransferase TiaS
MKEKVKCDRCGKEFEQRGANFITCNSCLIDIQRQLADHYKRQGINNDKELQN